MARPHDKNGKRIPDNPGTPQKRAEDMARYGAAAALTTTPTDYAKFLLEFLDPKPADTFRLNDASRAEMLRPQVKKAETTWEGLAWDLEQNQGSPMIFTHRPATVVLPLGRLHGAAIGPDGDVERRRLRAVSAEDAHRPVASDSTARAALAGFREAVL